MAATSLIIQVLRGENRGYSTIVSQAGFLIGRSSEANLQFVERTVSGKHMELLQEQDQWTIHNLSKSVNGTRLNGNVLDLDATVPLNPGDIVELNSTVLIGFESIDKPLDWSAYLTDDEEETQINLGVYDDPLKAKSNAGAAPAPMPQMPSQEPKFPPAKKTPISADAFSANAPQPPISALPPSPRKEESKNMPIALVIGAVVLLVILVLIIVKCLN